MNKKKIHIWCPSFRSFGGGIEKFTKELKYSLDKNKNIKTEILSRNDFFHKFKFFRFKNYKFTNALIILSFIFKIFYKTILLKPNLIFITHINFVYIAFLISKIFNIPFVTMTHGIEINQNISSIKKKLIKSSNLILTTSNWTKEKLKKIGLDKTNIKIIGNTASEKKFNIKKNKQYLRKKYNINRNSIVLLTVSRLSDKEKYKGYDKIIKILPNLTSKYPNIKYLIIGSGNDIIRIKNIIHKMKLQKFVTLCGQVNDKDLSNFYAISDVFALPSTGEGFGIVFIEALLSGLPVVGGNKDGSVDALSSGKLGKLVNPNSKISIYQGIQYVLEKKGPEFWYNKAKLRSACLKTHGREIFKKKLYNSLQI